MFGKKEMRILMVGLDAAGKVSGFFHAISMSCAWPFCGLAPKPKIR